MRPGSHAPDLGRRLNRDEDMAKPDREGRPPRHATRPKDDKEKPSGGKTHTNPHTGEPN